MRATLSSSVGRPSVSASRCRLRSRKSRLRSAERPENAAHDHGNGQQHDERDGRKPAEQLAPKTGDLRVEGVEALGDVEAVGAKLTIASSHSTDMASAMSGVPSASESRKHRRPRRRRRAKRDVDAKRRLRRHTRPSRFPQFGVKAGAYGPSRGSCMISGITSSPFVSGSAAASSAISCPSRISSCACSPASRNALSSTTIVAPKKISSSRLTASSSRALNEAIGGGSSGRAHSAC